MSAIDDLKELLSAASPGPWQALTTKKRREATLWAAEGRYSIATFHDQGHSDPLVCAQLAALARDLAQALVESQEALASRVALREHETSCDACWNGLECRSQAQLSDDNEKKETTALRLDGLAKAMKQETPRS